MRPVRHAGTPSPDTGARASSISKEGPDGPGPASDLSRACPCEPLCLGYQRQARPGPPGSITGTGFIEPYLLLQIPRTRNMTSVLTVHPRAEPYRIEHFSSQFGSARILFEPNILEREHWDPQFGSARARKFRAGRRFGSKMLGTVWYGSGMYGTGSPVCGEP